MDFNKVIEERHSVRKFKPKRVNFGDILEAIDSAIKGPFAGNQNNLKFMIVEDKKNNCHSCEACLPTIYR